MTFERWMTRLGEALNTDAEPEGEARGDLERVTALLLVEIARSDHDVAPEELATIRAAIAQSSSLEAAEIDEIVAESTAEADAALSMHGYVARLNEALDKRGKIRLVEQMWHVAFADGDLDRYEEHTIRKLSDLLYLKHRDFMQAKLRVLDALEARTGEAGTGAPAS